MRKLLLLLLMIFITDLAFGYFPLKETFFLDDLRSLTLEEASTAQPTPAAGSAKLYVKNGELTILDDSGIETAVGTVSDHNDTTNIQGGTTDEYFHLDETQHAEVVSEVGSLYIKNGGAELPLTNWTCSTGNFTITRNTAAPLKGVADFDLASNASALVGDYCSYPFTIEEGDKSNILEYAIGYIKHSAAYQNEDIRVAIYDVTAGQDLRTDHYLDTSNKFSRRVQTSTNTSYQLRFYLNVAGATRTLTEKIDGIRVGSQAPSVTGAISTDWVSYTPTLVNITGTPVFKWRREGSDLLIEGYLLLNAQPTGNYSISLPSGLTTGAVVAGVASLQDSAGNTHIGGVVVSGSGTTLTFRGDDGISGWNATIPVSAASGYFLILNSVRIPILGWSSNMKLSSQESGREIVFEMSGTPDIAPPTSYTTITGWSASTIHQNTFGGVLDSGGVRVPEDGYYDIKVFANIEATAPKVSATLAINNSTYPLRQANDAEETSAFSSSNTKQSNSYLSIPLKANDLVQLSVRALGTTPSWSIGFGGTGFLIRKSNTGNQTIGLEPTQTFLASRTASTEFSGTGVTDEIVSLALPSGNYMLSGGISIFRVASTVWSQSAQVGISSSGTPPTVPAAGWLGNSTSFGGLRFDPTSLEATGSTYQNISPIYVTLNEPTTVYLYAKASWSSGGAPTNRGYLQAVRVNY